MNDVVFKENKIHIKNIKNFNLKQTLDCGQAFRWKCDASGVWSGIAGDRFIRIYESGNDIVIENCSKKDFEEFWIDYFDLKRDYESIINEFGSNETLKAAAEFSSGIRILNQDSWEALCSFIISQNNNIPRIKGIIDRLCENFGRKTEWGYTFPSAKELSELTVEDLAVIRCGFRAKYILDAAKRVSNEEIDLNLLRKADYNDALAQLLKIKGVGPKVADCALLYGCGHIEAFPKDVWIKRALNEFFGGEIPECALKYAGIAQQYIFYYVREKAGKI